MQNRRMNRPLSFRCGRPSRLAWLAPLPVLLVGCGTPLLTPPGGASLFPSKDDHPVAELPDREAAQACRTTGSELEQAGHFEQAIRLYERALQKDPKQPDLVHRLAVLHDRTGDKKQAEARYHEAIERGRPSADLLNDYGYFLLSQSRYEEALETLTKATAKNPEHQRAKTNLAHAYAGVNRMGESVALYSEVVGDAAAYANAGAVAARCGRIEQAQATLREALRLDPSLQQPAAVLAALENQSAGTPAAGG